MPNGISLHIGLNFVNPDAYNGWDGQLAGCINDANDMESIAQQQGFRSNKLIDSQATSANVLRYISEASQQLNSGDHFLLTYSGHGGQVPDESGQESDGKNETWVCWDRQLLDNELFAQWRNFAAGVKIFVLSDSCHSGTMVRYFMQELINNDSLPDAAAKSGPDTDLGRIQDQLQSKVRFYRTNQVDNTRNQDQPPAELRFMDAQKLVEDYLKNRDLYRSIRLSTGPKNTNQVAASLIFISGCQDNQFSYDGDNNGLFTSKVLATWSNGSFSGGHRSFYDRILSQMPSYQTPNYLTLGTENDPFVRQKPFTLFGAGQNNGSTPGGSVNLPTPRLEINSSWPRNGVAPGFRVFKGSNAYYYIELATEARLFDYNNYGTDRNSSNFYATWADSTVSNRLTGDTFQLPSDAWSQLQNADAIYYRIGTTSSLSGWDNFKISLDNSNYQQAPFFRIVANSSNGGGQSPVVPNDGAKCSLIDQTVGRNQPNTRRDVKMIQILLNQVSRSQGGPSSKLIEDGLYGNRTQSAIEYFQNTQSIGSEERGVITPTSQTIARLEATLG